MFYAVFERSLSNFSMTSLKQHMEHFNFRCKIHLDLPLLSTTNSNLQGSATLSEDEVVAPPPSRFFLLLLFGASFLAKSGKSFVVAAALAVILLRCFPLLTSPPPANCRIGILVGWTWASSCLEAFALLMLPSPALLLDLLRLLGGYSVVS